MRAVVDDNAHVGADRAAPDHVDDVLVVTYLFHHFDLYEQTSPFFWGGVV